MFQPDLRGLRLSTAVFVFFFALVSQAKLFKNAYISFEMEDNWSCTLEQIEWVCRSTDANEAKEAVIILLAKEKGPTDTLPLYESRLNNPISISSKISGSLVSTVKYKAQRNKINDHDWLDALHQDSEVKNYFTRYLATIKGNVAVLVTFSAHNRFYAKHSPNFNKAIQTMRLADLSNLLAESGIRPGGMESFGGASGGSIADMLAADGSGSSEGGKSIWENEMVLGLAFLILAALLYVVFRIIKKKKG